MQTLEAERCPDALEAEHCPWGCKDWALPWGCRDWALPWGCRDGALPWGFRDGALPWGCKDWALPWGKPNSLLSKLLSLPASTCRLYRLSKWNLGQNWNMAGSRMDLYHNCACVGFRCVHWETVSWREFIDVDFLIGAMHCKSYLHLIRTVITDDCPATRNPQLNQTMSHTSPHCSL